jgi:hypothetical protein
VLSPELGASVLVLSRDGGMIVLGGSSGGITLLRGEDMQELTSLRNTRSGIIRCAAQL